MKHLPNLLKQETSSAETLVNVLVQMYYDPRQEHITLRSQVADKLLPCVQYTHILPRRVNIDYFLQAWAGSYHRFQ